MEHRRLLAASLGITGFTAGGTNLAVGYDVQSENAAPFDIGVFASADGVHPGQQLASVSITAANDLAVGNGHQAAIQANFSLPQTDCYLLAKIESTSSSNAVDPSRDRLVFGPGVFQTTDGVIEVQGSSAADHVELSSVPGNAAALRLKLNDAASTDYAPQTFSRLDIRAHGGADTITSSYAPPSGTQGPSQTGPLGVGVFGGANDASAISGGTLHIGVTVIGASLTLSQSVTLISLDLGAGGIVNLADNQTLHVPLVTVGAGGGTLHLGANSTANLGGSHFSIGSQDTFEITGPGTATIVGPQNHGAGAQLIASAAVNMVSDAGAGGANLAIHAGGVVNFESDQHLAGLSLDGGSLVFLDAGGLTLDTGIFALAGGNATVNVGEGSDLQASNHGATSTCSIAAGANLDKSGPGTLSISTPQSHGSGATLTADAGLTILETDAGTTAANLNIVANSQIEFAADQHLASLSLSHGAAAFLSSGGLSLNTTSLTVGDGGGTLDVGDSSTAIVSGTGSSFAIAASASLTKLGTGTLVISSPQTHGANATLVAQVGATQIASDGGTNLGISANAAVTFSSNQHLHSLAIDGNALVTVASGTLQTSLLTVGSGGGRLDVAAGSAVEALAGNTPSFSISAGASLERTGSGSLVVNGAQQNGPGALLNANGGLTYLNSNGGASLSITVNSTIVFGADQSLGAISLGTTHSASASLAAGGYSLACSLFHVGPSDATIDVGNLSAADLGTAQSSIAGSASLTKTGAGSLTIRGAQDNGPGAVFNADQGVTSFNTNGGRAPDANGSGAQWNLTINADATVRFGSTQYLAALNIGPGATVSVLADATKLLATENLTIATNPDQPSKLDLNDNDMIVLSTDLGLLQRIEGYVALGFNGGSPGGRGIVSSAVGDPTAFGLAPVLNGDLLSPFALFDGQQVVDANAIVKYTRMGDATLAGVVNDDSASIVGGYYDGGASGGHHWNEGDFTHTGHVNDDDVSIVSGNYDPNAASVQVNQPPVLSPISAQAVSPGQTLSFQAAAHDPDDPASNLTYSLIDPGNTGAALTAAGAFTWNVGATQAPGIYSMIVRVRDTNAHVHYSSQVISIQVGQAGLAVTDFGSDGLNLVVHYAVSGLNAGPLSIALYSSADGIHPDALLNSHTVGTPGKLTVGPHQVSLSADFIDPQSDYYLLVQLGGAGTSSTSVRLFGGGVYLQPGGTIQIQGTDQADMVRLSGPNAELVSFDGNFFHFNSQAVSGVHARLHGGDDRLITGGDVNTPIWGFGGAGNDILVGGNSLAANYLDGGAGNDHIYDRPSSFAQDQPRITEFTRAACLDLTWTFSGVVQYSHDLTTVTIEFGGLLQGEQTNVQSDGTFFFQIQLSADAHGWVSAEAFANGVGSGQAIVYIA